MSLNVVTCSRTQFANFEPEAGQVVIITDDDGKSNDVQMWTGTEWTSVKADTNSEIQMTAYDINKQVIDQLPALTKEEIESNKVLEVVSKGYLYKERIIKPAMVKVSE